MSRKRIKEKKTLDYQKLTERIAQENGVQTNLQLFFNPIADSWSEGMFFRRLKEGKYPFAKLLISIVFFLLPISFVSINAIINPDPLSDSPLKFISPSLVLLVMLMAGVSLLISGIKDFRK